MPGQGGVLEAVLRRARDIYAQETAETSLIAPISPSPLAVVEEVLCMLSLSSDDVLIDLGCGDGRWLTAAAKRAGCRGWGFDLNQQLLDKGRADILQEGLSSTVTLEKRDIFEVSLSVGTVIIVYLFRKGLTRIKAKLEAEVTPGARVVSVGFKIPGWFSRSTLVVHGLHIYVYRVQGHALGHVDGDSERGVGC
ncbi:unnamed protein product [Choristocarpus tenellus]